MSVILASRSPRRREILSMLGVDFQIVSADADESSNIRNPARLVEELALRKGLATKVLLEKTAPLAADTLIIAADTVVAVGDTILGKPKDEADAKRMLSLLAGKTHRVISGIALIDANRKVSAHEETLVHMGEMTAADIDWYVKSGEPMDKAGAYAIQGLAALWIKGFEGDYFNVVGLPVHHLNLLVKSFTGKTLPQLS